MLFYCTANPRLENLPDSAIVPTTSSVDHSVKLGWILLNKKLIAPAQLEFALIQQQQDHHKL